MGPILAEMQILSEQVAGLEKNLAVLVGRLSPILPDAPATQRGPDSAPRNGPVHQSPFGRHLQELTERLDWLGRNMAAITASLGI